MILYRLYTEDVADKREDLKILIGNWFPGYTILHGLGVWQGKGEDTTIVEISAKDNDRTRIDELALAIARLLAQECVLVVECAVVSRLIEHGAIAA